MSGPGLSLRWAQCWVLVEPSAAAVTQISAAEAGDFWGLPFTPQQIPSTSMGDGVPEGKPCIHTLPLCFTPCSLTGQQFGWEQGCTARRVSQAGSADGLGVLWPWWGSARGKGTATIPTCALGPRGCVTNHGVQQCHPMSVGFGSGTTHPMAKYSLSTEQIRAESVLQILTFIASFFT